MIAALVLVLAPAGDFERGLEAYEAERYAEAQTHFQAALEDPEASHGPVLYNLGHCAFRLGRYAEAIVYYTGALRRMPDDPNPTRDLNLARRELGLEAFEPEPPGPFARFDTLPPTTRLAIIGSLQCVALWGLLLSRRRFSRLLLAPILGVVLIGAYHLVRSQTVNASFPAVVVAEEIELRGEPHTNLAIRFELKAGEIVQVVEHSPRWVRISHSRGTGWVERSGLGWVE